MPLSGMGHDGEAPVYWDFKLDTGRGSGAWTRIRVPSCWEQEGFGTYYYGTQGRHKPDDDPIIPKETGTYRRSFELPASYDGRELHLVFEAAMTDTSVKINGKSAGATHQGGFYRFSYDITKLVKPGRNEIEVVVAKESSNQSVNHAERRGDYWTFGGIYRPVWLEARPKNHIGWTAIDARADGSFSARVRLGGPAPKGARLTVPIFDRTGRNVGLASADRIEGDTAIVKGTVNQPQLWTAETPHLYTARFELSTNREKLHALEQRFGFRTFEVRPRDGLYLNGRKIVLKGINRHSFDPDTGRTLTRMQNYRDARLIKSANMNAVRMAHYPPDPSFLEAADEIGLYVLNELAGWQGFYDTPTGARLIGQIVRRDVNHPSILFWNNGNEGGWNTENDGEFHRWDPQARPVLHPWAIHSGINTDHYENYDSTKRLSAGPEIFMPTEFLHGLYDGGIGAGFRDYWDVMGASPTVAGGFFWAFADEGIARSDRGGRIDNMGNAAPDGMFGPRHEKEGSFFTVKEIWSPVQVRNLRFERQALHMDLVNLYDFTDLRDCTISWRALSRPYPDDREAKVLGGGRMPAPALAPRASKAWSVPISIDRLIDDGLFELTVHDPHGAVLWTWTTRANGVMKPDFKVSHASIRSKGNTVTAGDLRLEFDLHTGELTRLSRAEESIALAGPRAVGWLREQRGFRKIVSTSKLRKLELAPGGEVVARAHYDGALRRVTWTMGKHGLTFSYELAHEGEADILGVQFDFPEKDIAGNRWLGAGPYRIWNNRQAGTTFGLHETSYSRSTPGETFEYPEFEGYFGAWDWLAMDTRSGSAIFDNLSGVPYFGLYHPTPGAQPVIDLPDVGWSFLHVIPSIGTKFTLAEVLGPQSQPAQVSEMLRGEIGLSLRPTRGESRNK
jgi:hypothetical protein